MVKIYNEELAKVPTIVSKPCRTFVNVMDVNCKVKNVLQGET